MQILTFSRLVYVDVESSAERKLYLSVLAASVASRAFNIRVSQVKFRLTVISDI